MTAFFRFFATHRLLANLFTVMVVTLGVTALTQMRRDIFPRIETGEVTVTTYYPGASPEDVELNVTDRIEEQLKTVSGIKEFTSYSMDGISLVRARIDIDAADKDEVLTDIRDAVTRVTDLPREVTEAPLVEELDFRDFPIIRVGVAGEGSYAELRETARLFRKKLENLPGVAGVVPVWYLDREIRIAVDPAALRRKQVSLQEIVQALSQRNVYATAGSFNSYDRADSIVTRAEFGGTKEVLDTVVRASFSGPALRVGDLAEVSEGFEEPRRMARINGVPAITFSVLKEEEADVIRTIDRVRALAAAELGNMPPGTRILFTEDSSRYIRERFTIVFSDGLIGFLLIVVVLFFFMNGRTAFWVAVSIPVVLLGTVFLMRVSGIYLEIISLTAMILILGILVDDNIIVSENIYRKRQEGLEPAEACAAGAAEVFKPIFTNFLTMTLAFAPLLFMTGVSGEFVRVMPLVIIFALVVSMCEVVVALPGHLVPGLSRVTGERRRRGAWFDPVERWFGEKVAVAVRHRYLSLGLGFLVFAAAAAYALLFMEFTLFPGNVANTFIVYIETPDGSSLRKTADATARIEQLIAALPPGELESFYTEIGSHGEMMPGESRQWAHIIVNLTSNPRKRRTARAIVDELEAATRRLEGFKEVKYVVEAGGPPVGDPVTIRIIGADDAQRRKLTDAVVKYLEGIEGVTAIDRNDEAANRETLLRMNYGYLSRVGLTVADVARTVRTAFDGEIATSVRSRGEDLDFRVLLTEAAREDAACIPELLIPNRQGRLIRLGEVAAAAPGSALASYFHFDNERTTTVTADIVPGTVTPVAVTDAVLRHFDLARDYPELRFSVGGEAEETKESFGTLYVAFAVALVAIYFLLVLVFNSVFQPFAVMVAIPFGITGVIIAFALHGQPVGFLVLIATAGLMGVVVNDSIVMLNHLNTLRARFPDRPLPEIAAAGAADRLRAIVMTVVTSVIGLIPLAYGIGGSDPFVAPMALALGYGMLFAAPLTLFLVPCLYVAGFDILALIRRARRKEAE